MGDIFVVDRKYKSLYMAWYANHKRGVGAPNGLMQV